MGVWRKLLWWPFPATTCQNVLSNLIGNEKNKTHVCYKDCDVLAYLKLGLCHTSS